MAETRGPNAIPQPAESTGEGERMPERLLDQAAEAVRTVADEARDLARGTYERSADYVRRGLDRYPEAGRYLSEGSRVASRPVEQNPILAVLAAGVVGYLLAYLLHGRSSRSVRDRLPEYAKTREYSRHRE